LQDPIQQNLSTSSPEFFVDPCEPKIQKCEQVFPKKYFLNNIPKKAEAKQTIAVNEYDDKKLKPKA
jgi:hypothetical protein